MSTLTALVLVAGALAYALLDHVLRIRRASHLLAMPESTEPHAPDTPEPYESETRMSMSQQQLRTLGLSHVRRAVQGGKVKPADIARWKEELGEAAVQKIIDDAKASAEAPAPAPREHKKTSTSAKE
jgi:hypothetical protein